MAYAKGSFRRSAAPAPQVEDDSWKADAFINLYLPRDNGTRGKIGTGIPLRATNPAMKQLIDWLLADEANVALFKEQLILEVNSAEPKEGNGFSLVKPAA